MKILCIGDSLGMPRENVRYEDTWFYKLSILINDADFIDKFRRQMSSEALKDADYYYSYYNPDLIIVQIGVCDCSPRIINTKRIFWKLLIVISSKFKIEKYFWRIIKRIYSRNNCDRVWVPLDVFCNNINEFIHKMKKENPLIKVIFIGIGTPSFSVQKSSPFMLSNASKYNEELEKISNNWGNDVIYVNPLNSPDDNLYVDGYHPNRYGHDIIFNCLRKILADIGVK